MTQQEIISKSVRSEDYNSNNAWGFGGKRGKYYYFENPHMEYFKGYHDYRHAPSSKAEHFYIAGRNVEKEEFVELLNK